MNSPVFVLGTQRSGTTLLARILSAHPEIQIQNELHLPNIFVPGSTREQITSSLIGELLERSIDIEKLESTCKNFVWGLKDPQLTEHIDLLRQFQDSKFLLIVRDGRGVTNSYIQNRWGLGVNAYYGAIRWRREVKQLLEFQQECPDRFLRIRYEDLISDIEHHAREACDFLGKAFRPEMLDYYKQKKVPVTRENQHTHGGPNTWHGEKWRRQLSSSQIDVVEHVAGDVLRKLRYELAGNPIQISPLKLFRFWVHQTVLGEIQIQYRWRRSAIKALLHRLRSRVASGSA